MGLTIYVQANQIMVRAIIVIVAKNVGLNMVSEEFIKRELYLFFQYHIWHMTDTTDGQDKYYRKCGRGLDTGCYIQTTEIGVKNILDSSLRTVEGYLHFAGYSYNLCL